MPVAAHTPSNRSKSPVQRRPRRDVPPRRRSRSGVYALGTMVFLLIGILALGVYRRCTTLDNVIVTRIGDREAALSISDANIIRQTGLELGASIYQMDASQIASRVNGLGVVRFAALRQVNAHTLEIVVEPRVPRAAIRVGSNYIYVDAEGYMIRQSSTFPAEDIIIVSGRVPNVCKPGDKMDEGGWFEDMLIVVNAIYDGGYTGTYSELKVDDSGNLVLIARSKVFVHIGDALSITDKLRTAWKTLQELNRTGQSGGRLTVEKGFADYRPPR